MRPQYDRAKVEPIAPMHLARNERDPEIPMIWPLMLVAVSKPSLVEAKASPRPELVAAFKVAFPDAHPITVARPAHPLGFNGDDGEDRSTLVRKPHRLVVLGGDRYALIVLETDYNPVHPSPGAISIAYLHKVGAEWRVDHTWPEYAWPGSQGEAADSSQVVRYGRDPLLVLDHYDGGQGEMNTVGWVIRLSPKGPQYQGWYWVGGNLDQPDISTCCANYRYSSTIEAPRRSGALFSVHYRGWKAPARHYNNKRFFQATADIGSTRKGLVATPRVHLPDDKYHW